MLETKANDGDGPEKGKKKKKRKQKSELKDYEILDAKNKDNEKAKATAEQGKKKKKKKRAKVASKKSSPFKKSSPSKVGKFAKQASPFKRPVRVLREGEEAELEVALPATAGLGGPRCRNCKTLVSQCKSARVSGKCFGSWICGNCNSRQVQLRKVDNYKNFMEGFAAIPEEARTAFWLEIAGDGSQENLSKVMNDTLTKFHKTETVNKTSGDYLPLSWYEKQGFDPVAIEANCKDTQQHPVLGLCYRVEILGGGTETRDGHQRNHSLEAGPSGGDGGMPASGKPASVPNTKAQNAAMAASSKAQQKVAADEIKKMKQEAAASKALATKVLGKLSGELVQLEVLVKGKVFASLPEVVQDKTKVTLEQIKGMVQQCKDCLGKGCPCTLDIGEVWAIAKTSLLQRNFVSQVVQQQMASQMP